MRSATLVKARLIVIPGRDEVASPESMTPVFPYSRELSPALGRPEGTCVPDAVQRERSEWCTAAPGPRAARELLWNPAQAGGSRFCGASLRAAPRPGHVPVWARVHPGTGRPKAGAVLTKTGVVDSGQPLRGFRNDKREVGAAAEAPTNAGPPATSSPASSGPASRSGRGPSRPSSPGSTAAPLRAARDPRLHPWCR
jgi:hypothetical protein